jgi:ribonuclease HI
MGLIHWHSYSDCQRRCGGSRILEAAGHYNYGVEEIELPINGYNFVRCSARSGHTDGIVVAVHGACRHTEHARTPSAAYSVYVSPGSPHSYGAPLPDAHATSHNAELRAGIAGLMAATVIALNGAYFRLSDIPVRQVVVKTDSAHVVHTVGEQISTVQDNGPIKCSRGEPGPGEYAKKLAKLVARLESMGIAVHFWHVKREDNREAIELARNGLDNRRREMQEVGAHHSFFCQ